MITRDALAVFSEQLIAGKWCDGDFAFVAVALAAEWAPGQEMLPRAHTLANTDSQ